MNRLIRPEIKLIRAFMPVLVTRNFDDDSIKHERASLQTVFSHYVSGKCFRRSKAAYSVVSRPIWPKSSFTASIKRIGSKTTEKRWRHRFSRYKSTGAFCCHGNQSYDPICPKTLCSLSPSPMMLHIKL